MKAIDLASPIKVWYKPLPKFPKVPWPIVDIKLSYKDKTLPQSVFSLIDSGANFSILHMEVARVDFQKFKGYFEIRFRQDAN